LLLALLAQIGNFVGLLLALLAQIGNLIGLLLALLEQVGNLVGLLLARPEKVGNLSGLLFFQSEKAETHFFGTCFEVFTPKAYSFAIHFQFSIFTSFGALTVDWILPLASFL
jgi:hypothetical protein